MANRSIKDLENYCMLKKCVICNEFENDIDRLIWGI